MNGYDFDKTIYDGDCFINFYLYNLARLPYLILWLPFQVLMLVWFLGWNRQMVKQCFATYLIFVPNKEKRIEKFWDINIKKIKKFYFEGQKEDDVIVSASPYFMLRPICKRLKISHLIATEMNLKTGVISGKNCYGNEKVVEFEKQFKFEDLDKFYSDSESDLPIMNKAKEKFFVLGDKIIKG